VRGGLGTLRAMARVAPPPPGAERSGCSPQALLLGCGMYSKQLCSPFLEAHLYRLSESL